MFHVLGDPTRLRIICLLLERDKLCVSDIHHEIGISMSGTSQHLRQLEQGGLANRSRSGQQICYFPNYDDQHARTVFNCIDKLKGEHV